MIESTPVSSPPLIADSMSINNAAFFDRLADVQLPAEPNLWPLLAVAAAVTLAVIVLITLTTRGYRRYYQATPTTPASDITQQALTRLNTIEQAWLANDIDAREAAYRLSTVLRLGLGLPQLTTRCPPSLGDQQPQWQQTIAHFEQLRYQSLATPQLEQATFAELRRWLIISADNHTGDLHGDQNV